MELQLGGQEHIEAEQLLEAPKAAPSGAPRAGRLAPAVAVIAAFGGLAVLAHQLLAGGLTEHARIVDVAALSETTPSYTTHDDTNIIGPKEDKACQTELEGNSNCGDGENDAAIPGCTSSCNDDPKCYGFVTHPWGGTMKGYSESIADCEVKRRDFKWHVKDGYEPPTKTAKPPGPSYTTHDDTNIIGPKEDKACQTELEGNSNCGDGKNDAAIPGCTSSCNDDPKCYGFITHPWGGTMKGYSDSIADCEVKRRDFKWHVKDGYEPPTTTVGPTDPPTTTTTPTQYCSEGVSVKQKDASVCCDKACGTCGGKGCNERPGGADACCTNKIITAGVTCSESTDTRCVIPTER